MAYRHRQQGMALTGLDQNKPTVTNVLTGINGQINTPITTDGTYLYFGTWPGGSNGEPTIRSSSPTTR